MTEFTIPGLMPLEAPKYEEVTHYIPLASHSQSRTIWDGITMGPITEDGETMAFPALRLVMEFTPQLQDDVRWTLDSEEGADGLTYIIDSDLWIFEVPAQALPLDTGLWNWKIKVWETADEVRPLYEGTILITP